jgi:hypothetical protein
MASDEDEIRKYDKLLKAIDAILNLRKAQEYLEN